MYVITIHQRYSQTHKQHSRNNTTLSTYAIHALKLLVCQTIGPAAAGPVPTPLQHKI